MVGEVLALGALLAAHQGQFARTLMLEPARDVVHVVVHASVTGEKQRALLALGPKPLEAVLSQRALDGVRLFSRTATLAVTGVETKLDLDGRLELMIHGTARIPGDELGVETAIDAEPLDLVVLPGDRPVLRATRGAEAGGVRAKLGPGDRVRWQMLVDRPRAH